MWGSSWDSLKGGDREGTGDAFDMKGDMRQCDILSGSIITLNFKWPLKDLKRVPSTAPERTVPLTTAALKPTCNMHNSIITPDKHIHNKHSPVHDSRKKISCSPAARHVYECRNQDVKHYGAITHALCSFINCTSTQIQSTEGRGCCQSASWNQSKERWRQTNIHFRAQSWKVREDHP